MHDQLCLTLCKTLRTVACQTPLSMGFSRQEYWSGFLYLLQGIFLTQGSSWPRDRTQVSRIAGRFFTTEPLGKSLRSVYQAKIQCQEGWALSGGSGRKFALCLPGYLAAASIPWLAAPAHQSRLLWSQDLLCVQLRLPLLSLIRIHVIAFGAHLNNTGSPFQLKSLNLITPAKTFSK